jgi:predicted NUDIX family NTP pyrophosphohydrolase
MKQSAGILLYKKHNDEYRVLLAHPGGPFWKNRDLGAWSIPKGEFTDDENPLDAAIREFEEETGVRASGDFIPLGSVRLQSGKTIFAWALEQDIDATAIKSNEFEIEWPPKSGKRILIPEVDRAEWFPVTEAMEKINPAQARFITALTTRLKTHQ